MARRLKRAWVARLTVAAAVLALPLFAAGVASAAIAGANQPTTVGRPDLRSVTLTSSTSATYCFDKTLSAGLIDGDGNGFFVQGYRVDNRFEANSASVDPTSGMCVLVGFPATVGDINQYTIGTVLGGIVTDNLTGLVNNTDATALTFSTTTNGTTGHTTGPDLTGILTPSGSDQANNQLEYVFDQSIIQPPSGTNFYYIDSGGNICWGGTAPATTTTTLNGTHTVVTVSFPKPCPSGGGDGFKGDNGPNSSASISSAVRGGVVDSYSDGGTGPIVSANDAGLGDSSRVSFGPAGSAILPSAPGGGSTTRASVVSAALSSTGDSITYTFNTNVVIVDSTDFAAVLSNGQVLFAPASSASLVSPNVVSVSFGQSLSSQDEYAVKAALYPGGVEPAANPVTKYENTFESVNLGDNAGALGRGFTTGADVFGVVFNASNGTVTADLDQRIFSSENEDICILNSAGDQVANPNPVAVDIPTQAAGPEAVVMHFVAGSNGPVAQGTMIEFGPDCVAGSGLGTYTKTDAFLAQIDNSGQNSNVQPGGFVDEYTASQIVAPVGSGARLHAYHRSHKKHKKHHSSKRH